MVRVVVNLAGGDHHRNLALLDIVRGTEAGRAEGIFESDRPASLYCGFSHQLVEDEQIVFLLTESALSRQHLRRLERINFKTEPVDAVTPARPDRGDKSRLEIRDRLEKRREETGISFIVIQGGDKVVLENFAKEIVGPLAG